MRSEIGSGKVSDTVKPLQALGVSPTAEAIYFSLAEAGESPVENLPSLRQEISRAEVGQALAELESLGLVAVADGHVSPLPPLSALESYAERRAREALLARESAAVLARFWHDHQPSASYLETVTTSQGTTAMQRRLLDQAEHEVRALVIGPVGRPAETPRVAAGTLEALARGVAIRAVYGAEILRRPAALAALRTCVDAGQQARVFPDVSLHMLVGDDREALLIFRGNTRRRHALVVRPSGLLNGLAGMFESFWRMAVPLAADVEPDEIDAGPTPEARRLLGYLSAGLTDESIARELGVSERTVARRIARLQEILGAQTRFQLGVQAARQGWI
ncbi:helix-turn-helix transcriptional regulator [Microtetraspora niveoalba]|uniref:helix-turn-helix transcriptional regulator n=1 Tax=Microtetraspora niveoalba TaxID=46175 RepID=UPI0008368982|nr:helix-turn-helix transcriptional regulator [Microtetraspora niveoalba]